MTHHELILSQQSSIRFGPVGRIGGRFFIDVQPDHVYLFDWHKEYHFARGEPVKDLKSMSEALTYALTLPEVAEWLKEMGVEG